MTTPDLMPCPFCGAHLDYAAPVAYVHPVGKCILSGRNFAKGVIGQWNKRAHHLTKKPSVFKGRVTRKGHTAPFGDQWVRRRVSRSFLPERGG